MMSNPSVSIIIPNYNHSRFLPKRIGSIVEQTYQDYEIIILDDCSEDDSLDIINSYIKSNPRIQKYVSTRNSGSPFKQWYKGIQLAKGEYVWIAESDDYADKEFLSTLVTRLKADPKLAIAFCQSYRVDENDNILFSCLEYGGDRFVNDFMNSGIDEFEKYGLYSHGIYNASAVVFRRSSALEASLFLQNFKYAGDAFFWNRLLLTGDIYFCSQPLNYFRRHEGNRQNTEKLKGTIIEEYEILDFFRKEGQKENAQRAYQRKKRYLMGLWISSFFSLNWRDHLKIYKQAGKVEEYVLFKMIHLLCKKIILNL